MDLFKGVQEGSSEFLFAEEFQRCPFLKNVIKPTCFSFSSVHLPLPVIPGAKGPIFEDGPSFDMAFKVFHGEDGIVPLSGRSHVRNDIPDFKPAPCFNPLAGKAASISLSSFGFGGPFGFGPFSDKNLNKKKQSKSSSSQGGNSPHEALGNEWFKTGNCPIAKSYRAVSKVLPLVANALQPPPGMNFKCPAAVVAARAALARTALVKSLRPQPLPAKMLAIAALGMAVNVPLGVWREHTVKFSLSWFVAVHAAVPFIAMLRKSVLMPKTAMALTIAASIVGQVIGSRAERLRMKQAVLKNGPSAMISPADSAVTDEGTGGSAESTGTGYSVGPAGGLMAANHCGAEAEGVILNPLSRQGAGTRPANVCF